MTGHRSLVEIKSEIDFCINKLNCSRICISGGEPLLYPEITQVVEYIHARKIKPIILSNGENLTPARVHELEKAGLFQFYLHVDSGQNRPNWVNKTEAEMNALRQHFVEMISDAGKIKCGFNITIRRSNLTELYDIVKWFRSNISRVNHLSLITFRGIPKLEQYNLYTHHGMVNSELLADNLENPEEINISTLDIHHHLHSHFKHVHPAAYLNGTSVLDSFKYLIIPNIGNKDHIFGEVGAKTVEIYQYMYHLIKGKYDAVVPQPGRWIFPMSITDRRLRKAFYRYVKYVLKNPIRIFYRIYIQTLILQQPFEIVNGQVNLCRGCINLMPYKGELINSCRLDEYRLLGGPINVIRKKTV